MLFLCFSVRVCAIDHELIQPRTKTLEEGDNHLIECYFSGKSEWVFVDKEFLPDNVETIENQLVISSVSLFNHGIYMCSGRFSNGSRFFAASTLLVKG